VRKLVERLVVGDRHTIAGTVYGTIIVMSVLAAGAKAFQHSLWRLDVVAAVSAIVLWLAHVYSHGLGESLHRGRRLTADELFAIARREQSIMLATVPPIVAVTLGAVGLVRPGTALWLAFGIGVVTLGSQGLRYAQLERMGRLATIATVSINLVFGLAIVAAEVLIAH
jgi:hypothetical protein